MHYSAIIVFSRIRSKYRLFVSSVNSTFSFLMITEMAEIVNTAIQFESFNPSEMSYQRWIQRFEGSCMIFNLKEEGRVPYLLRYLGSAVYNNLCDSLGTATSPYTKTYKDITDKLTELYEPESLVVAEIYKFNIRKQLPGEDVQSFANALVALSEKCKFETYKDTALRSQFILGLSSTRVLARLLETKDLDFKTAVSIARSMELSKKEVENLHSNSAAVNLLQAGKKPQRSGKRSQFNNKNRRVNTRDNDDPLKCYRCGGEHAANKCPRRDLYCEFCKQRGHLDAVCFKKNKENKQRSDTNVLEVQSDDSDISEIL